jgi:hypothetical protein
MCFDANDLQSKAKKFTRYYRNTLKFRHSGSKMGRYKMNIRVKHQIEWLVTESGYDNTIASLWVNPSTLQPERKVIANEISHHYQVIMM